jgi:hypothetical protein
MSQGDYLKRKQLANALRVDGGNTNNNQPAVFGSHDLLKYKQYQIINDDSSTNINYNLITPTGTTMVFDMERKVANCPSFIVCKDTNTRPNRVLNNGSGCRTQILPLTWFQRKNVSNSSELCICQLKRKHINRNVCSCDVKST